MSYVSIYRIEPNGDMVEIGTASNAWGFCALTWEALGAKYKCIDAQSYWMADHKGLDKLWSMADGTDLEPDENLVLQAGFDRTLLHLEDAKRLPDALEAFYKQHGEGRVSTMLAMAKVIREGLNGHDDALGIGIEGNSISCDWYNVYDEEADDSRPYNINKDTGHKWAKFNGGSDG
jgi:hypothetical protein